VRDTTFVRDNKQWWDCGSEVCEGQCLQWTMSGMGLRFARDNVCEGQHEFCEGQHLQDIMRFASDNICNGQ
jgi:hypothetical protein